MNNKMTPQEIKFRGFRTETNDPVYGDLIHLENSYAIRTVADITYFSFSNVYHIHPSSLGMFTGLTDKNGKEIYGAIGERGGDITESAIFGCATIVWDEYNCAFVPKWHTKGQTASIQHATKHAEIIGNQWETGNGKV